MGVMDCIRLNLKDFRCTVRAARARFQHTKCHGMHQTKLKKTPSGAVRAAGARIQHTVVCCCYSRHHHIEGRLRKWLMRRRKLRVCVTNLWGMFVGEGLQVTQSHRMAKHTRAHKVYDREL